MTNKGRLWGLSEILVKELKGNRENGMVYTITNVPKEPSKEKLESLFNEIRQGKKPNNSSYTEKE